MFSVRELFTSDDQCALTVSVRSPYGILPQKTREAVALLDTGSGATLIRADLARDLSLEITGIQPIVHPSHPTPVDCLTTFAEIVMQGENRRTWTLSQPLIVAPGHMAPGLILGMDCFREGKIIIHFPERWWRFTIPPDA